MEHNLWESGSHEEVLKQRIMALVEHFLDYYYLTFQGDNEDLQDYLKTSNARAQVINTYDRQAGNHPTIIKKYKEEAALKYSVSVTALHLMVEMYHVLQLHPGLEKSNTYRLKYYLRIFVRGHRSLYS